MGQKTTSIFTAANLLTGARLLCSAALLFFPALSPAFYAIYLAAGITDMLDGAVARKTHTVSAFGSRFDTAADLVFVAVCLYKLAPVLELSKGVWIWIGAIALIKAVNVLSGLIMRRKLFVLHTAANKLTGLLLFALPLTLPLIDLRCSAVIVCAAATFAAVQEGHFIRTGKKE